MDPDVKVSKLVLIVEDEPDNREIMRSVVEELLGHRALLVADGESALEAALTQTPDLIVMDLMMPVLDGFEAIRRLKSAEATSHIPVIAVTALGRPSDRQRAIEEGADDYVSKPFDVDDLASTMQRHLDGKLRRSETA